MSSSENKASAPAPPTTITVKVRAVTLDKDGEEWIMGDDLLLTVSPTLTFRDFAMRVKDEKDIPLRRMKYSLPPARDIPESKWGKNLRQVR